MRIDQLKLNQYLWDPDLLAMGRVREIRQHFLVEWMDGSTSTLGREDLHRLQVVTFPDLSDRESVERWLASDGPGAP